MTGAAFLADIALSGSVFGLSVGDNIASFDSRLKLRYVEEMYGRKGTRVLRRDYGLFEATFEDESSWRCLGIIVEINRLAPSDDLVDEILQLERVELCRYTAWSDVLRFSTQSGQQAEVRCLGRDGDYEVYLFPRSGVVVHVVGDEEWQRSERPGFGDVWSIELSRANLAA